MPKEKNEPQCEKEANKQPEKKSERVADSNKSKECGSENIKKIPLLAINDEIMISEVDQELASQNILKSPISSPLQSGQSSSPSESGQSSFPSESGGSRECGPKNINKIPLLAIYDEIMKGEVGQITGLLSEFASQNNLKSPISSPSESSQRSSPSPSDQSASPSQSGQSASPSQSGQSASPSQSGQSASPSQPSQLYSQTDPERSDVAVTFPSDSFMQPALEGSATVLHSFHDQLNELGINDAQVRISSDGAAIVLTPIEVHELISRTGVPLEPELDAALTLASKFSVPTESGERDALEHSINLSIPTQSNQSDDQTTPRRKICWDQRSRKKPRKRVAPKPPVNSSQGTSVESYALPQTNIQGRISEMVHNMYPELFYRGTQGIRDHFGIADIPDGILMHSYDRLRHQWEKKCDERERAEVKKLFNGFFNELLTDEVKFLFAQGRIRNLQLAGYRNNYLTLHIVRSTDTAKYVRAALVLGYVILALSTYLLDSRVEALKKLQLSLERRKECASCKGSEEEHKAYENEAKDKENLIHQSHVEVVQFREDLSEGIEVLSSMEIYSRQYEVLFS